MSERSWGRPDVCFGVFAAASDDGAGVKYISANGAAVGRGNPDGGISHLYPSPARPTYGVFVHDQARELVSLGCDVRVISPTIHAPPILGRFVRRWETLRKIPKAGMYEEIPVHYPRYLDLPRGLLAAYSGYLCYVGIRRVESQFIEDFQPDIIHAHTVLPDGFAAMLLKRWAGCSLPIGSSASVKPCAKHVAGGCPRPRVSR